MSSSLSRPLEMQIHSNGKLLTRSLVRPGRYVLGSEAKCDIVLNDVSVSGRQAVLTVVSESEIFLKDLQSANGTFVDNELCAEARRVGFDSVVQLGQSVLTFWRCSLPASAFPDLTEGFLGPHRYAWGNLMVQGGSSTIFEARDRWLNRTVAIRALQPAAQRSPRAVLRFAREAQIMAQLQHPYIPPVYDLHLSRNDELCYVTRAIDGETLGSILEGLGANEAAAGQRWSLGALLTVWRKAAEALAYAHSRGVVHSDLRPENIIAGSYGEVMVIGWGYARITPPPPPKEGTPASTWTAASGDAIVPSLSPFTAPEQIGGSGSPTERADVYALGAILLALLTGKPPLAADDPALAERIAAGDLPVLPPEKDRLRAQVQQLAQAAMQKAPEQRPANAGELLARVEGAREQAAKKRGWADLLPLGGRENLLGGILGD